jgi:hypothetical protein
MQVMRPRLLALLAISAALAALPVGLAFAQDQQQQPQKPGTFSEEMEVREIGLVVEMPESFSLLREMLIDPGDVLVSVDGVLRPATRLSSEAPRDWTVAVYVDEVLAPPETVFKATLALAKRAERLAGLGPVEVIVADPGPHPELAPNRAPLRIKQALSDFAGRAQLRQSDTRSPLGTLDAATLRRQCDRLIAWASAPRPPGPRVLFLVADGFAVTPEEVKALETGSMAGSSERAAVLLETARLLAAYGWTTVPLPLRETREVEATGPARPDHDLDRFRIDHQGTSEHNISVPRVPTFAKRAPSPFHWEGALTLQIEPDLSPLRALTVPTAGELVGLEMLLDPVLDDLSGRWQLWFQAPENNEGRARPLQVRLKNGTMLRTRTWLRSSTPEEAAAARVRTLLLNAMDRADGNLPLQADLSRAADGRLVVQLTVAPSTYPAPVAPGPVRLSWAFAGEEGAPEVRHEMAHGIVSGEGWSHSLTLDAPPGVWRLVVAVDDLARERWNGVAQTFSEPRTYNCIGCVVH